MLIEEFERTYSRFNKDSFLSRLAEHSGRLTVPQDFIRMLHIYDDLYRRSAGRITPLGGQLISDLGYDREYAFIQKKTNQTVPGFSEVLHIINSQEIFIEKGLTFDLGALGKGFLIDRVMENIRKNTSIKRVLINAGGDIAHYAHDEKKARIALEHPEDQTKALGVVEIGNEALASSGVRKRQWSGGGKQLHHIIDPLTGNSSSGVLASWVIHPRAAIADALATSLFLTNAKNLNSLYDFDHALITNDGRMRCGKRFEKVFEDFLTDSFSQVL